MQALDFADSRQCARILLQLPDALGAIFHRHTRRHRSQIQEFRVKLFKHLLSGLVLSGVTLLSPSSFAAPTYTSIVIFGDSLSDSGNNSLHPLLGTNPTQSISGNGYIPSQTYASGTYSNGPVWATQFAAILGLSAAPSLLGGTNYAYGGALTGFDQILHPAFPELPIPSLKTQANAFLAAPGAINISSTLFIVAGGGNDARATFSALATETDFGAIGSTMATTATAYANNVGVIVDQLQASGAQNIVVWNTPNIGLAPAISAEAPFTASGLSGSQLGSMISGANNGALSSRLSGEAGVQIFDLYALLGQTVSGGQFTNATDACGALSNLTFCPDINTALFWDGLHPTTAGHAVLASKMVALTTPVPEPETYAMLLVGLLVVGRVARRRGQQT